MISELPLFLEPAQMAYTNLDHRMPEGFEVLLRQGLHVAEHLAWNFHATIWFMGGVFHEEVWESHELVARYESPDLATLIETVNKGHGYE